MPKVRASGLVGARRVSSGNRRASGLFFPAEIWANVGTFPSASLASEARLDIGQPDVIRPAVAADCRRMAAPVVRAIDQETANAGGTHLGEGDLLAGSFGHAAIKARSGGGSRIVLPERTKDHCRSRVLIGDSTPGRNRSPARLIRCAMNPCSGERGGHGRRA
jgi:hypothetical protein